MTIANDLLFLSLRNAGVCGVGQTPQPDDINDSFVVLNAWIEQINIDRAVMVNASLLPTFPDLTTDVPFWTPNLHVLLTSMSVRLREIYSLPPIQLDVQIAVAALKTFNAINLQQVSAPTIAANDGTGYGIVYLALRAAGRVTDNQGVLQTSQDVTDAASLMNEMLDEWNRERAVKVIPGTLPTITNLATPVTLTSGVRNAIVLNLAVRLRDWVGAEVSKTLLDRATTALGLVQANNQHQTAPLHPGPPETVIEALFLALRMAGRITDTQSVSDGSKDVADAFSFLVMMLAQWQRKRWLLWNEEEVSLVANGQNFYTIGPGQDFDVARPDKIHAAFIRLPPFYSDYANHPLPDLLPFQLGAQISTGSAMSVDIPLSIIESKEDWAGITIKSMRSFPAAVFYDSAWPVGRVFFWPVPTASDYELHLVVKASLPVYQTVNDQLSLPPEYTDAVVNNLAVRIALASPSAQVSPLLLQHARASLNTVKLANSQVPLLNMPSALSGHRTGDVSSWVGRGLGQAWTTPGP